VTVVAERDVRLGDGRALRTYDTGDTGTGDGLTVVWQHPSPHTGVPLAPLLSAAAERGIRLVTYARPSYGASSPFPGRDVASAAGDVAQVADALGVTRFAVIGASGGGAHALACAALLAGRVTAVVCLGGIAPFTRDFDWYAGMASDGGLRAATAGREARARYAASAQFNPDSFTSTDWAALSGGWSSLGAAAERANEVGPDGLIDDDIAFVTPWGFDLAEVEVPVLLVQGGEDRVIPPAHADWLLHHIHHAELWLRPHDGHISVLNACPVAMDWLRSAG
jgi:pimeloyl-ACP methyl ester carboxylesterase